MRPEVNSNHLEMSFRLHGDFTAATFETLARLYCTCANDLLINANLINAKQTLRYWLFFKQLAIS